jgi:hypothetical protein
LRLIRAAAKDKQKRNEFVERDRYGRSEAELDDFSRAYGWDIRDWPGYTTLRDIRDLQTLSAPLRLAVDRSEVADELHHRIHGLRARDYGQRWRSF